MYPSSTVTDTPDCAGPMLDLVEKDIIRIQDPLMHGMNPQVVGGKNWNSGNANDIRIVCGDLHDLLTAARDGDE